jgi:hypothetical protein
VPFLQPAAGMKNVRVIMYCNVVQLFYSSIKMMLPIGVYRSIWPYLESTHKLLKSGTNVTSDRTPLILVYTSKILI